MNSYQRVMGTLSGEKVDRRPVSGVLSLYGARLTGCPLSSYYSEPKRFLKGQVAVVETFEPDLLLSPMVVAKEAAAFGCQIKHFDNYPPNVIKRVISNATDIKALKIPDIGLAPELHYILESVQLLSQTYKGQIPIAGIWLGPYEVLALAVGVETFMELMLFHTQLFEEVLIELTAYSIAYGNKLLEAGADVLIHFASMVNVAMITPKMAQENAQPMLAEAYKNINGGILMHSGGYKIGPYMAYYRELPNLMGFVVDSKDRIITTRQQAGPNQLIAGNIDGPTLDTRSPEQIAQICRSVLNGMAADSHFMLCSSAADIPYNTSPDQIRALMHATRME